VQIALLAAAGRDREVRRVELFVIHGGSTGVAPRRGFARPDRHTWPAARRMARDSDGERARPAASVD
jgi:hypothetical protein